jgi:hypothetical protein
MSFGKNPHVAKAQAAEEKARSADDARTASRTYLEAAHLWDRAAEREKPGKFRDQYEANAAANRELAEAPPVPEAPESAEKPDLRTMN